MRTVRVDLGDRTYQIHVGPGARRGVQNGVDQLDDVRQLVVIADKTVAGLHLKRLITDLRPEPLVLTFQPGEKSKSLPTVERLCDQLAEAGIERNAVIIAFGGGVAGDLAGFVAATWLRGVRFIQVPTTLLAAVDASVGGKTGVNLARGKNLVGAFHQPQTVIIDTEFLETLSARDYAAGLAESVKHAVIRDSVFLDWHEENVERIVARDADALSDLIARNCEIKAAVVAQDEREAGLRAILNHGHTIGHALEHLLSYELRHGECVALGMLVENELACARNWLGRAEAERIRALLARLGLPATLPRPLQAEEICTACRVDKKVRVGAVNFILMPEVGMPRRVADVTDADIASALAVIEPAS